MPSWSIHCAIAKKVNEHLKVDENLFLFGNILPDVDDSSNAYGSYLSHFYGTLNCDTCPYEELPDIHMFYKLYSDKLTDPLILGYYCHLLTDYYFNYYTYTNHWLMDENQSIIGVILKNGEKSIIQSDYLRQNLKRKDFAKFGKELYDKGLVKFPEYDNAILKHAANLTPKFINDSDILLMVKKAYTYLDEVEKGNHQYTILDYEELSSLLKDVTNKIIDKFKELKLIKGSKK